MLFSVFRSPHLGQQLWKLRRFLCRNVWHTKGCPAQRFPVPVPRVEANRAQLLCLVYLETDPSILVIHPWSQHHSERIASRRTFSGGHRCLIVLPEPNLRDRNSRLHFHASRNLERVRSHAQGASESSQPGSGSAEPWTSPRGEARTNRRTSASHVAPTQYSYQDQSMNSQVWVTKLLINPRVSLGTPLRVTARRRVNVGGRLAEQRSERWQSFEGGPQVRLERTCGHGSGFHEQVRGDCL
jgi:hypothetical protein